jgi:hypothetical protein
MKRAARIFWDVAMTSLAIFWILASTFVGALFLWKVLVHILLTY